MAEQEKTLVTEPQRSDQCFRCADREVHTQEQHTQAIASLDMLALALGKRLGM